MIGAALTGNRSHRTARRRVAAILVVALCGVTLFEIGTGARAEAKAKGVPAQVRALHTLADLGTNVESFCLTVVENAAAEIANPASPLHQSLDAEARTRWLTAIQAACDAEQAKERHLAAFAAGYDPEAARAVTDWYTSETGRRLLAMETAAARTDWDAEVVPFVDEIVKAPVPVDRVKLAERIEAAIGATEDAALLQAGVASILTYGGRALAPPDDRVDREVIDAGIEQLRQHVAQQMQAQESVVFMFVYRDASDAELAAFADFAESGPARWLFATHRMAMAQLIAELREDVEARLAR